MHLAQPPESFGDDLDYYHTSIFQMPSVSATAHAPIEDIFGPDLDSQEYGSDASITRDNDTSSLDMSLDTRRLQAQHNTVGYREGITAGKAGSIQTGFDQGFALGANIGIRAGQILGLLEGISAALAESNPSIESARLDSLLAQAAAELNPERIFTPDFWAADGTWKYPVMASHEDSEVIYPDVADQHPLISKWAEIARRLGRSCYVDEALPILESKESAADDDAAAPGTSSKPEITSRDAIEW